MTIFWVNRDATGGNDDGTSEANGFLTIDQAMNAITTAGAGPHKVWIKKTSGSYTEQAVVDTVGTQTAPVVFEGYETTTGDGVQITIDGSGVNDYGIDSSVGNVQVYYVFKNIIVTDSTGNGFDFGTNGDSLTFINCQADTCDSNGFLVDRACRFYKCVAHSNGSNGFSSDLQTVFVACRSYSNGTNGFQSTHAVHYSCLSYNNTGDAFSAGSTGTTNISCYFNCTADCNNTASVHCIDAAGEATVVVNCILYDAGTSGYGVNFGGAYGEQPIVAYNLVNSNAGGDYNNSVVTIEGDQTGAPAFTAEGSDYTLAGGSPALDAGVDASGS